jgi:malonyl-CoA decarboxylase
MPGEPLVFVEIALTRRLATKLAPLLDEHAPVLDPDEADTANFYSITSCQPGLTGVNLGNELLEAVVERLAGELPGLRTFATLSPIPGFARWLERTLDADDLRPRERAALPPVEELRAQLRSGDWVDDERARAALRKGLTALCARYLLSKRPDGRVLDPVANFHLSNGARVEQLDWLANPTPAGLSLSHGLMVNYRYDPDRIAANAASYATERTVAASDAVRELVDTSS